MQAFSKATVRWHDGTPVSEYERMIQCKKFEKEERICKVRTCQRIVPLEIDSQRSVWRKESSLNEIQQIVVFKEQRQAVHVARRGSSSLN